MTYPVTDPLPTRLAQRCYAEPSTGETIQLVGLEDGIVTYQTSAGHDGTMTLDEVNARISRGDWTTHETGPAGPAWPARQVFAVFEGAAAIEELANLLNMIVTDHDSLYRIAFWIDPAEGFKVQPNDLTWTRGYGKVIER